MSATENGVAETSMLRAFGCSALSVLGSAAYRPMTAHRTQALQVWLADNAHVALASIVHALLQQVVIEHAY